MLDVGVSNLTPLAANSSASWSGRGVGPVVVTLEPSVSSPEMWPFVLS